MKYYEKMLSMGHFSLNDISELTDNKETARSILKSYIKKGLVKRVKRDFYVAISLETGQAIVNRFIIASNINENSIVSHHSAFEFYGYANQVFYEVQVTSINRFRNFEFDGIKYRRIMPQIECGIVYQNNVRVTTIERTVIDYILLLDKVGGLEELLRCIALIPSLDEKSLIECLAEYNNGFLYQKTGCILSLYASTLGLTNAFFIECKKHLPKGKSYFYKNDISNLIFYEDWNIYGPSNLTKLSLKGVDNDATI